VIRDKGPNYNIGYGITGRSLPLGDAREGADPESSFIAKALHDHPIAKFFSVGAASLVGMHVAGKIVRDGGVRLLTNLIDSERSVIPKTWRTQLLHDFHDIQKSLDDWEGVTRGEHGKIISHAGFSFSKGDKAAEDTFRRELQSRLVAQARRLPYELPALYATQKAPGIGTDALFGTDEEKPNWASPVDVLSDFAYTSTKNLAAMLIPFEAGGVAVKRGWKNIITYGDSVSHPGLKNFSFNMGTSLHQIGHKASDIIAQTVRFSQKSSSVLHSGISEAISHSVSVPQFLTQVAKKQSSMQSMFDTVRLPGMAQHFMAGARTAAGEFVDKEMHLDAFRKGMKTVVIRGKEVPVNPEWAFSLHPRSTAEEIAASIVHYGGSGASRASTRSIKGGQFFGDQMDAAYKDYLINTMKSNPDIRAKNIPHEDIEKFVRLIQIGRRPTPNMRGRLAVSEHFNFANTMGGSDREFVENLGKSFSFMPHGKTLSESLYHLTEQTDRAFLRDYESLSARTLDQWNTIYRQGVIPFANRRLKQARLPYEHFDDLSNPDVRDFLVRNTAEQINRSHGQATIPLTRSGEGILSGTRRSFEDIAGDLHGWGFSLKDPAAMRDFLVSRKVIAGQGSKGGFNAFGFRRVSVEDALSKRMIRNPGEVKSMMRDMADMADKSSAEWMRRTQMGDVFETSSGRIVDLSPLTHSLRRTASAFGNQFQIPFLGIPPFKSAGLGPYQQMSQTPIFQISPGGRGSYQPFAGGEQGDAWLFTRERGAKGKLSRLYNKSQTEGYIPGLKTLDGTYRAMPTDPYSLLGRNLRLAIGDKGQGTLPGTERGKWGRLFNVDRSQPDSLLDRYRRAKVRKVDIYNPNTLARLLSTNDETALRQAMRTGGYDDQDLAKAYQGLGRYLKQFQISPNVIRKVVDSNPAMKRLFTGPMFSEGEVSELARTSGLPRGSYPNSVNVADIHSPEELVRVMRSLSNHEHLVEGDLQKQLTSADRMYLQRHIKGSREPNYFDKSTSKPLQQRGITRRFDEAKADLISYLSIKAGLEGGGKEAFNDQINGLLDELLNLKNAGKISQTEYTETQAATLSLQMNFSSITQFDAKAQRQNRIIRSMNDAISLTRAKQTLRSVGQYDMESGSSGPIKSVLKRMGGVSEYQYPGTEYNPFAGGQETAFVPTFRTAASRNGARGSGSAIGSVLGINNWSNPDAFSGSSIPVGHGFQRLNNYMTMFNGGLDETAYRGSLDFYARGLVGQRALPIVAGGAIALAADRTIGGYTNSRDANGERVYSPYFLGRGAKLFAHGEAALAGAIPGGQTKDQKSDELFNGETAVRKGRWWPLGNTPWRGGRVMYYRPSWYRRLQGAASYTDDTNGSPLERLAYGYDFSPLRPLDPYRFEREHYSSRPYPVSGEYFNGPWGPLTSVLNATVGRVLKPQKKLHEEQVKYYLSQAQLVGAEGVAVNQSTPLIGGVEGGGFGGGGMPGGGGGAAGFSPGVGGIPGMGGSGSNVIPFPVGGRSGQESAKTLSLLNKAYEDAADGYSGTNSPYGLTVAPGAFAPQVTRGGVPLSPHSLKYKSGEFGYQLQEMMGIYGFAFGATRSAFGLGDQDMNPRGPVLASPANTTSIGKSFWDQAFGGLGDAPLPIEGPYSNLEVSEIARRFVTRERAGVTKVNPIVNQMGQQYPWLPGSDYFTNFKQGDPYTSVALGEIRLPGAAYQRFNSLHPDVTGKYGAIDQFKILGDVAPFSNEYKLINKQVDQAARSDQDRELVRRVREQVASKSHEYEFSPHEYLGTDYETTNAKILGVAGPGLFQTDKFDHPISLAGVTMKSTGEADQALASLVGKDVQITYDKNRPALATAPNDPVSALIRSGGTNYNDMLLKSGLAEEDPEGQGLLQASEQSKRSRRLHSIAEYISHRDTYFNTKFLPERTAVEDWERRDVYGSTFPQWQHPIKDFLRPAVYKATNRGPVLSAFALGAVGRLFASEPRGKAVGTLFGATAGLLFGTIRGGQEELLGQRFIPKARKQEVAVEEYVDILSYIKSLRLRNEAAAKGDDLGVNYYTQQAQHTMFGADLKADPETLSGAIPERKREHFRAMMRAPVQDRQRILSTAGRLERRMYESAWGMPVEARPNLVDYFKDHELPDQGWEGWTPDVGMENVKIKVAQNLGLDVSQMGYYPQQITAANAVNPAYPAIRDGSGSQRSVAVQLQKLLMTQGAQGNVRTIRTPYPGTRVNYQARVA
jgi:hypothetical protein